MEKKELGIITGESHGAGGLRHPEMWPFCRKRQTSW
ncbi:rCG38939, isoform CRA_c [Rattus norvegicus]|uniref:RCG38939, isoform CRA_c n=1 Tax=Rattus norvegicus TaxID=10116 RepID=A6KL86_RAT|nr:rCG38939, isoform CRA_c [Rattus norvegicus]